MHEKHGVTSCVYESYDMGRHLVLTAIVKMSCVQ